MFAAQEYRTYAETGNKAIFESVVTLENSENSHQEYFKRLLLRRLYLYDDFSEGGKDIMLFRVGMTSLPHTLEEIGQAFGVTRERIRSIEAKILHKMRYKAPFDFLRKYTTQEEFEKATRSAVADKPWIAEKLQEVLYYFFI